MKILLDENFPLPLFNRLQAAGYDVEHIIILGQRGVQDSAIRRRIAAEELLFLTQDTEFEEISLDYRSKIIISRVRQSLPIQQRVGIWFHALEMFLKHIPAEKLFDLFETGQIIPWEVREL